MKLGGIAATKFASKKGAYYDTGNTENGGADGGGGPTTKSYQTSDQVRAHYYSVIESNNNNNNNNNNDNNNNDDDDGHQDKTRTEQVQNDTTSTVVDTSTVTESNSVLPVGWEDRQKKNWVEQQQHGAFAKNPMGSVPTARMVTPTNTVPTLPASTNTGTATVSAEVALVKVATYSLEQLAGALQNSSGSTKIPMEDRAAFAKAVQKVMAVMAKQV